MFNKRSFLMGTGVGIIIGALLLQLFYLGESSQIRLKDISRDLEEGIGAEEEARPSSPALETDPAEALSEAAASAQPEATAGDMAETRLEQPVDNTEGLSDQSVGVVIRIEPGAVLAESAELLARAGVIAEQEALIRQMKASNQVVRAGYFLFPHGMTTTAEAIAIITGKPLTESEAAQYGDLLWNDVGLQL